MSHFRFFAYQFILISGFIAAGSYYNEHISKPFDRTELFVIGISAFLFLLTFHLMDRLYEHLRSMRLMDKILLSILAFVLASLMVGLLLGEITF
ncbi:hypothetical protein RRU94_07625 [Domibacillus sp. DTU_2020_1001157_1_SI_ALB_TIR_016]|uniref:hypothetical protein n=1 Tax=Domibacillus sp. DTU_2020_1001157_1_SI_ALB_TIR_016 TaxID=3077789 RepID=UPI0028E866A5|nr:hypothetical protein [Domibacillus sp. DTU_2020_1001157_1_SI_ALB_TIR_016]WNS78319.1 hypothetical protein RRU94_07625 [Domibacillus sp. DTU_2020_1001157_1_SI_ALB_TIR_016]